MTESTCRKLIAELKQDWKHITKTILIMISSILVLSVGMFFTIPYAYLYYGLTGAQLVEISSMFGLGLIITIFVLSEIHRKPNSDEVNKE